MPNKTTNYELKKPLPEEAYDISVQNENMDVVDGALKSHDAVLANKVDKVAGKALSTNDFTTAYKNKVDQNGTDITALKGNKADLVSGKVPTAQLPALLALGETSTTAYRGDRGKAAYDHVSDGDKHITAAERTKLAGIEAGATNYTHPANHPPNIILQDADNRFMKDAERTKLAGIETGANKYTHPATHPASIIVQDASNRFMTDTERTKLNGIATGANNYTHPANHPPNIITQDANNRFVTDAEKTAWNGKAAGSHEHAAGDISSGTLPVSRGGTGQPALTANSLLVGNNTGAVQTMTLASARMNMGLGFGNGELAIANGGTGASTAIQARINLGIPVESGFWTPKLNIQGATQQSYDYLRQDGWYYRIGSLVYIQFYLIVDRLTTNLDGLTLPLRITNLPIVKAYMNTAHSGVSRTIYPNDLTNVVYLIPPNASYIELYKDASASNITPGNLGYSVTVTSKTNYLAGSGIYNI